MDSQEIKPRRCPFCGRKPSLAKGKRVASNNNMWHKAGDWLWKPAISCRPCRISRDFETTEEAVAWWNGVRG